MHPCLLILTFWLAYPVLAYATEEPFNGAAAQATGSVTVMAANPGPAFALPFGAVTPLPGALAISANGRVAAHISAAGQVLLWDAKTLITLATLEPDAPVVPPDTAETEVVVAASNKHPTALALSADGDLLAIGYADARVEVRSSVDLRLLRDLKGHTATVTALRFSANDKQLASGSQDATTQLWEIASGRSLHIFDSLNDGEGNHGRVIDVSFSGDGRSLIVNEWYSRFYDVGRGSSLWDLATGLEIGNRSSVPPNVDNAMRTGHALGGKGWLLAYTGTNGLLVERLDSCQPARQMPAGAYADTVAADTQGRWVVAADEQSLHFFAVNGSQQEYSVALPAKAMAMQVAEDGRSIFALLLTTSQSNGNENFIFGRDAETVTTASLYRLAVPPALLDLPPLQVSTQARLCPASEAARRMQDFKLPARARQLPLHASLPPGKQTQTDPQHAINLAYSSNHQVAPVKELYFGGDDKLYALYYANSDLKKGVAVWQVQTGRLLKARFDTDIGDSTMRVPEGWLNESENITDILTGKLIYQYKRGDTFSLTAADQDTGEVFRSVGGVIQHYSARGQRMPDIKASALIRRNEATADVTTENTVPAITARNGRLAALYADGSVQVWRMKKSQWQLKSVRYPAVLKNVDMDAGRIKLSADGRHLQVEFENASGDGPTHYISFTLGSHRKIIHDVLLSPLSARANRAAIADTRAHRLAVIDYTQAKTIARLPRQASIDDNNAYQKPIAAISEDGRLLASASYDGLLRVWNVDNHQLIGEAHAGKPVSALAFAPHGKQVAAGLVDGRLLVWRIPAQK